MNTPTSPDGGTSDLIRKAEDLSMSDGAESLEPGNVVVRTEQVAVKSFQGGEGQETTTRIETLSYYTLSRRHP